MTETQNFVCHGCGVSVSQNDNVCVYCGNPIAITNFKSITNMSPPLLNKYLSSYRKEASADHNNNESSMAIAFCYLKLKIYDMAKTSFDKALESNYDNPEIFFYAAISSLNGKKAFLAPRSDIDKAIEYLLAAIMIEPRAIYYYALAYIKYDFFTRKSYKISPDYQEELAIARSNGLSVEDKNNLYSLLCVEQPGCL